MQQFVLGLVFIVLFAATARADTQTALTASERTGLMRQIAACWNIGGLSANAQRTAVTLAAKLQRDGTVKAGSVRLIGSANTPTATEAEAYAAAKRAILRCEAGGYKLPLAKYDQWQSIEMTFDPERTRVK